MEKEKRPGAPEPKGILASIRETGFSLEKLTETYPELDMLKNVPQNPQYHSEGDVYCHTRLVCRKVTELEEWQELTEKEQETFFQLFGDMADRVYLERLSPAWPDFDITQSGYLYEDIGNYEQPLENRKVCPYLFYIMVVNADGTVSTCVGDWKHHQIVGDIRKNSLKDIWLGERQRYYQLSHLQCNRCNLKLCQSCQVIIYGCYDNIDHVAEQIAEKMYGYT